MRKGWSQVRKGQPYAVEWPEYHVECGHPDCRDTGFMTATGEAFTRRDAENLVRERGKFADGEGWLKWHGLWYCPKHGKES